MANILVSLPVSLGAAGYLLAGHPHCTLTHPTRGTITLPVTRPNPSFDDSTPDWATVPRPGRDPLLLPKGNKLWIYELEVVLFGATPDDDQAEFLFAQLRAFAADRQPVVVNNFGQMTAGTYQITSITGDAVTMRQSDNHITRAELKVQLTAVTSVPPAPGVPPTPNAPSSVLPPPLITSPGAVGAQASAPRRYTVKGGDTLWAIAVKMYGNGQLWTKIASRNNIKDPRSLQVGAVLVIP